MKLNLTERISRRAVVLAVSLAALIPFYALLLIAMKSPEGGLSSIRLFPDFHLINFPLAWKKANMGRSFFNSTLITFGAVGLLVILAGMAGFSIGRVRSGMNRIIMMTFLLCMMIPGIINTVPLYTLLIKLRGINTYWAMIVVLAVNAMPFAVFLYSGFIRAMPVEMEESAVIDGCSPFGAFWRITFPLLKPVTASVVILQGLGMWNNFAQAVFFLQNRRMRTIPLAISMFFQQYGADWPLMAAAAVLGLLPAVTAFLVFQKFFIQGITTGAIKG
ncbi:MAG: carbohydrate ABC transporter permease [Spirochaetales bacterium]|nr:carbohydrate ABC transporter permease [Spirochaetales bacterium]